MLEENYQISKMGLRNRVVMLGGGLCKLVDLLFVNDSAETIRKYS